MWSRVARGKAPLRQAFQRIAISGETQKVDSSAGIEGGGEGLSTLCESQTETKQARLC